MHLTPMEGSTSGAFPPASTARRAFESEIHTQPARTIPMASAPRATERTVAIEPRTRITRICNLTIVSTRWGKDASSSCDGLTAIGVTIVCRSWRAFDHMFAVKANASPWEKSKMQCCHRKWPTKAAIAGARLIDEETVRTNCIPKTALPHSYTRIAKAYCTTPNPQRVKKHAHGGQD